MNEKLEVPEVKVNPRAEIKPVLVETEGFQCMAYQDCHGKWRTFYGLKLLSGEVEVVATN
ncbi:MAG TPA: hypothetical protein VKY92_05540 [Verrucomicrobiae bacterium]|nr:hypothetical protein [Verrucomicrobiae bacterium]